MSIYGMDDSFDFEAAGYAAPADWARLHDLLPDPGLGDEAYVRRVKKWRDDGSRKAELLAILIEKEIYPHPFDPETVGRRNVVPG